MKEAPRAYDGVAAALPLAAAATIFLARWLPVRFAYRENDLGIVSRATVDRYPIQQETFWLVFAVAVGAVLTLGLSRVLRRARVAPAEVPAVEGLAIAAFLAALWLPAGIGLVACAAAAVAIAWRAAHGTDAAPDALDLAPPPRRPWALVAVFAVLVLIVAPLLTPGVWTHLYHVANHVPDERLAYDNFKFLGETGQHLAWANALSHGRFQGRDFFCLYGPLYDLGLVGFWSLVGRSVAAWNLYWAASRGLAWVVLLVLCGALVRRRTLVVLVPFLLPWVELRVGLPLLALLFVHRWLHGGTRGWCVAAGAVTGIALLYSQEFATAFLVAVALVLGVRRDARAALTFAASAALAMAPLLAWYAANDALAPMLGDLFGYPRYMLAGYGKLPFPSLIGNLPLAGVGPASDAALALRLAYVAPAVCLAALLLALGVSAFEPRRPLASLRALVDGLARDPERLSVLLVAVFGLVSFRSAMGRSSLHRTEAVLPAVALLIVVAMDRAVDLWRAGGTARRIGGTRLAALALLVILAGFPEVASPIANARRSLADISVLRSHGSRPRASLRVMRVARWVQLHTEPGEPVLFLPNIAAYYYLTDRPNPIRFVQGHQIPGAAERDEVLAALRARPPRYVVWDEESLRVDDLSDELVFGREILAFLEQNYAEETQLDGVTVLRRRE